MMPSIPANLLPRATQSVAEEHAPAIPLTSGTISLRGWKRFVPARRFEITSRAGIASSLIVLSALVLVLYAKILWPMVQQWWSDPNYSHGFLVPIFAAYMLWRERRPLSKVSLAPSNWGLCIMVSAFGVLLVGTLGSEHFTARISLLFLIAGMVVFLAGWQALRRAAFPLGYLAFMVPLPAIIYYQLTFPLQLLASRLGASGLVALGVPTIREGNLLILPNVTLEVVEACSGVRSLLSLLAAVTGYAVLCEPRLWKRALLIAAVVPVVIASNGLRLVASGALSYTYGPQIDSGWVHGGLGLLVFVGAFLAILAFHAVLRRFPPGQIPAASR